MVITDQFVFIHEPKTGGTFVRKALAEVYRPARPTGLLSRGLDLLLGSRRRQSPARDGYKTLPIYHGTCHDIPAVDREKPILSVVRNPFDLYVCFYYFGWWHTHPEDSFDDEELVRKQFPSFPNLSFEEFVTLANTRFDDFKLIGHNDIPVDQRPGWYTTRFVRYYFKDPHDVYPRINDDYIESGAYRKDMFDVHFMRTHRLNQDLHSYLLQAGVPRSRLQFILNMDPIRPEEEATPRPDRDWARHYSAELKAYVLRKEKLLFSIFPDLASAETASPSADI